MLLGALIEKAVLELQFGQHRVLCVVLLSDALAFAKLPNFETAGVG